MFVLAVTACAATRSGPRVAVLPEVWATTRPLASPPASPRITRTLSAHNVTAVADEAAAAAMVGETDGCVDDLACLRRVGERLGAGKLVTLQLAELGQTLAVQLTLIDVHRAAREATMREVVQPNEATRVAATLDVLGDRVARQTAVPEHRRSRAWWWVGAGGLVVAAAAVTLFVLSSGDNPDSVIVPP